MNSQTYEPRMANITYFFYATILDTRDRGHTIPIPEFGTRFAEIHDLDLICQQNGGVEIARKRELGNTYEDASTIFQVGNAVVINKSFGWHPDRGTTVQVPEGSPVPPIVKAFEAYYMCKAQTRTTTPQPTF